jgi:hypothetical protein
LWTSRFFPKSANTPDEQPHRAAFALPHRLGRALMGQGGHGEAGPDSRVEIGPKSAPPSAKRDDATMASGVPDGDTPRYDRDFLLSAAKRNQIIDLLGGREVRPG